MIEVKHLTRRYGKLLAVDDVSFSLQPGRIYGFLGPNGAGKSTTMNILTGYLSAAEGSVTVNGWDVFDEPLQARRQIGYLPEQPPLYMDMTVMEYLKFVAGLKKVPAKEAGLDRIVKRTGLKAVQHRLIRTLSKGYKQRVGIAQALVGDPPVIILDEPTVGLDPLQRIEVRELIRGLGGEHTVLLSSHILSEISEVADVVLILSHGRLVAQDTPENLARRAAGSNRVVVTVKGDKTTVREAIKELPLTSHEILSGENDLLELHLESSEDIREALFYALAEARCPIYAESSAAVSLEDIFLELTGEEKAARAAEKKAAAEIAAAEKKAAKKAAEKAEGPATPVEAAPEKTAAPAEKAAEASAEAAPVNETAGKEAN